MLVFEGWIFLRQLHPHSLFSHNTWKRIFKIWFKFVHCIKRQNISTLIILSFFYGSVTLKTPKTQVNCHENLKVSFKSSDQDQDQDQDQVNNSMGKEEKVMEIIHRAAFFPCCFFSANASSAPISPGHWARYITQALSIINKNHFPFSLSKCQQKLFHWVWAKSQNATIFLYNFSMKYHDKIWWMQWMRW